VRYLSNLVGVVVDFSCEDNPEDDKKISNIKHKEKFIKGSNKRSLLPEIDRLLIAKSVSNGADYFLSLGFNDSTIKMFELGTMTDDSGVERGTIPIRDNFGRLVGLSGRRVVGNDEPRYKIIKDFKKSKVLYNLYNARKVKDRYNGKVIVVEGFKALWYVFECGFENVCAVMGAKISSDQVNLLVRHNFSECILMLDGDKAGKIGMDRSLEVIGKKIKVSPIYLPDGKSPDDISKSDITDILSTFLCF
jgi:hypothetical protein